MRIRPQKSARQNAARLLPRLAQKFFLAADETVEANPDARLVRPFSNVTHRFCYSLEYFRSCYGGSMEAYLKTLRDLCQVQEELDACLVSRALYETTRSGSKRKKLLTALDQRQQELLEKLRSGWRSMFQSSGAKRNFLRYLEHPPAQKQAAPGRRRAKKALG